ncbi:MAG: HAMP domain-containing sensor histidine kinase [Xenococcaceae cyanobacterium MO_207.B15]|nr:HAMP domain-containing sensor histidine kinase [Xenococcaceae cyanobacterium MO_207.B15]MDJ0745501.1 HAMP domain-containing sensor histidine kinase [Xenococcaceae cyanobacterium MO_167.B27]
MATILGISGTALYVFFNTSLNQQLDHRLLTLAQAAVPSLDTVKFEGRQSLDRDIPWRALFYNREQSLEWFDVKGELLAREGDTFPRLPLVKKSLNESSPVFEQENQIRSVTIAVYTSIEQKELLKLKGYIRASESVSRIDTTLNQLKLGLWLGGGTALFFISISSIYLTNQAFKPTLQSFQQLKQFMAEASHELRNPLTKINFATEALLSHPDKIRRVSDLRKLEMIKNSADQMKQLLEDLLFLARTDSMPSSNSSWDGSILALSELLLPLVDQFQALANHKGINFETQLLDGIAVKGDPSQLNRAFSNLLENALKYTETGGIISLNLEQSKGNAIVSVEDTGIGIDPEQLPFIFQRFWRAERVRREQREGLGLGLAIVQAIIQKHKGKITVKSEINVGTCFKIYLPLV